MRSPAFLLAFGLLLGGCIIYETDDRRDECRRGDRCADDTGGSWRPPRDTDPPDDTDDPEPSPSFALSAKQGEQGRALLTWIEADSDWDFERIERVVFVGDVDVVHTEIRRREAFLLLDIPCGAEPGTDPVIVALTDGTEILVQGGFTILEAASPDVCGCDN